MNECVGFKHILHSFAEMSIIKIAAFGEKCLEFIGQFLRLSTSRVLRNAAKESIQDVVL